MSARALTGLGAFGQSSSAAYPGMRAGAMTVTSMLISLYSFSLMMTFTLLRHKPNYLAMIGVPTVLVVSLAIVSSSVDWIVVAALTPAWLFLASLMFGLGGRGVGFEPLTSGLLSTAPHNSRCR